MFPEIIQKYASIQNLVLLLRSVKLVLDIYLLFCFLFDIKNEKSLDVNFSTFSAVQENVT